MGSCTSGTRNVRPGDKSIRQTVTTNENHFSNPQVRARIFSKKDSKAPQLNLEKNSLRNKRITNLHSTLATQQSDL